MSRGNTEKNQEVLDNKQVEEKAEETVEEIIEEKPEEKTEETVEEKPEETVEETAEEKAEEKPEEKAEETAEEKPEETVEEKAEEKAESLYEQEPFIDPAVYRQRRKKKIGKKITAAVLITVFVVYFGGVIFHSKHFGTMVTVNGMDVSGKNVKKVESMLLEDAAGYCLDIKFKNDELKIALGDAKTTVALTEDVEDLLKQHSPFLWVVDSFRKYNYKVDYTVSCDKKDLQEYMETCAAMHASNMKDPQDAKVVLEDGEARIIPDETGTKLDVGKVYDKVLNALKQYQENLDLQEADCYVPAHILADSESILKSKEEADEFISMEAAYDFDGYIYQIPKEELTTMAYVSSDGSVQISKSNVAAYVEKLKKQFSTADTDREFTTHDNKTILVHGGYYGWVIDGETETEELYERLCEKKSFTKEPACERHGYAMCEQNDIGSTYVEIDLSNQHVYFYRNGKLKWDSDCVSGQTPGHKTPGGLYGLTYKKMHATLIGEDYSTPVAYWMPFNGGIGLHDASWRSKFGDDIYTYSGSHGCVNLPVDKAAELFDYVEEGMPIVCYWRDEAVFLNK